MNLPNGCKRYMLYVALSTAILLVQAPASSQVIAIWNFNGTTNGVAGTLNTVSIADFSPSVPTRTYNAGSEYFGHNGWPTGGIDMNYYLEFSLSPITGYALNLSSLVLRMRHSNTGSSGGSGPKRFSVRSSLDNYATDIATGNITSAYANYTIPTNYTFGNLPTSITFRVYGYMAVLYSGGNNRFVFDNISVNAIGLVLPAQLKSFSAAKSNPGVTISYTVDNALAGGRYTIQRSADGTDFQTISVYNQHDNETTWNKTYHDRFLPSALRNLYYRLKIEQPSGEISYSPVQSVDMPGLETEFRTKNIGDRLLITGRFTDFNEVTLHEAAGRCILRSPLKAGSNETIIPLPGIRAGVYYLCISGKNKIETSAIFINP